MLTFLNGKPADLGAALLMLSRGDKPQVQGTRTEVQAFCAELQTACDNLRARFAAGQSAAIPRNTTTGEPA